MSFIEVSEHKYINAAQVCSVQVFTHTQTARKDLGYGMKGRSRKVGETFTLRIITSDGAEHRLSEELSAQAYDVLLPDSAALPPPPQP